MFPSPPRIFCFPYVCWSAEIIIRPSVTGHSINLKLSICVHGHQMQGLTLVLGLFAHFPLLFVMVHFLSFNATTSPQRYWIAIIDQVAISPWMCAYPYGGKVSWWCGSNRQRQL